MRKAPTVNLKKDGPGVAVRKMKNVGTSTVYVVDSDRKYKGIATIDEANDLKKKNVKDLSNIIRNDAGRTSPDTPIKQLLSKALSSTYPVAVLDDDGHLLGIVDRASIISEVNLNDPDYETSEAEKQELETKESV